MKVRRSDRLIDMTAYFLNNPHKLISLTYFAKHYESAKSSISEDLAIIKRSFNLRGLGVLETIPGAAGGARFIPSIKEDEAVHFIKEMIQELSNKTRLLPGDYVYISDLLGRPDVLRYIGRLIARQYMGHKVDAIMTAATKGVPIAQSLAYYLNVPFVIVRHDSKITEGATVSVNYVSGSAGRIEKMELAKRSLPCGSHVVVVDDFMKGGGTVRGMKSMIAEFNSELVGITVFAEAKMDYGHRVIDDYTSLLKVDEINTDANMIHVSSGNYLEKVFGRNID